MSTWQQQTGIPPAAVPELPCPTPLLNTPCSHRCYGGQRVFHGPAHTIKCFECNTLVRKVGLDVGGQTCIAAGSLCRCRRAARLSFSLPPLPRLPPSHLPPSPNAQSTNQQALEGPGNGRVLVVDGGGSTRCALVGDALADLAVKNGWKVSVHCVREEAVMLVALWVDWILNPIACRTALPTPHSPSPPLPQHPPHSLHMALGWGVDHCCMSNSCLLHP